jgi:hypothetical protein
MTRLGLIPSNWNCENNVGFGCRLPCLSIESDAGSSALETRVAP